MGDIVSGIGGLFGTAQKALGIGDNPYGVGGTPLQTPVSTDQATDAYRASQDALQRQQDFVTALAGQNGIGNQSAVYNQLSGIANGTGPNPAQAALNQATSQNIANQSALMAGQRGAAANPALIARMAAQQGGALQQQAAGQGATMQAQQQLGAMGQMAGIAGQQTGLQAASLQGLNQAAQSEQQNILGAIGAQNNAQVGMQSNLNNANAGLANTRLQGQQKLVSNVMQGIGAAVGMADGGEVPKKMAVGGFAMPAAYTYQPPSVSLSPAPIQGGAGPASFVGQYHSAQANGNPMPNIGTPSFSAAPQDQPMNWGRPNAAAQPMTFGSDTAAGTDLMAGGAGDTMGGGMDALMAEAPMVANKGAIVGERYANQMKPVPGKAKVKGDSLKNDTVPAKLSPGEIILPRSVTMHPNAPEKAAEFVRAIMAKKGALPTRGK